MNTRLKQFLVAENISQSQFADTLNVAPASISHVLAGRNKPGYDFIKAIMSSYPDLSMDWLILGNGKMYKSYSRDSDISAQSSASEQIRQPETDVIPQLFDYDDESLAQGNAPIETYDQSLIKETPSVQSSGNIQVSSAESPVTPSPAARQRKAMKVIILFDDGTFQEM